MFIDEVKIKIQAGKGGDGLVSFRREKYVPKGGPDGGDGGKGGDVIFKVNKDVNSLNFFNTRKDFQADNGQHGSKNRSTGKSAQDLILNVPRGTIVYKLQKNKKIKIVDLKKIDEEFIIGKGGKGGLGNVNFASATNQTPQKATRGRSGEQKNLMLELRLIADVGLIGLPNAGKSTLLSRISQAKPKIANYPFTTLEPNLGVSQIDDFTFVIADIPGLIEGASKGKGLGDKFLRHIKRTKILVHLLECGKDNLMKDYKTIRKELKEFSPNLLKKPEIIVVSKVDLLSERQQRRLYSKVSKLKPFFVSTATRRGIKDLLFEIKKKLTKNTF